MQIYPPSAHPRFGAATVKYDQQEIKRLLNEEDYARFEKVVVKHKSHLGRELKRLPESTVITLQPVDRGAYKVTEYPSRKVSWVDEFKTISADLVVIGKSGREHKLTDIYFDKAHDRFKDYLGRLIDKIHGAQHDEDIPDEEEAQAEQAEQAETTQETAAETGAQAEQPSTETADNQDAAKKTGDTATEAPKEPAVETSATDMSAESEMAEPAKETATETDQVSAAKAGEEPGEAEKTSTSEAEQKPSNSEQEPAAEDPHDIQSSPKEDVPMIEPAPKSLQPASRR